MKTYTADKEFQVGRHTIGWISLSFHAQFKNVKFTKRPLGPFQKLPRSMMDAEIKSELRPGLCELGDVLALLENPPEGTQNGYANIFYVRDAEGVLRAVLVSRCGGVWSVGAYPVTNPSSWGAGRRVFSRATGTQSLGSGPSGTLTLERAVEMCKEAGYQVTKIL